MPDGIARTVAGQKGVSNGKHPAVIGLNSTVRLCDPAADKEHIADTTVTGLNTSLKYRLLLSIRVGRHGQWSAGIKICSQRVDQQTQGMIAQVTACFNFKRVARNQKR